MKNITHIVKQEIQIVVWKLITEDSDLKLEITQRIGDENNTHQCHISISHPHLARLTDGMDQAIVIESIDDQPVGIQDYGLQLKCSNTHLIFLRNQMADTDQLIKDAYTITNQLLKAQSIQFINLRSAQVV